VTAYKSRRPDWSVAPPPHPAERDVGCTWPDCPQPEQCGGDQVETEHECRPNLVVPMAPWLLARAVRRAWRRLTGARSR
jgi:hypothetical protein